MAPTDSGLLMDLSSPLPPMEPERHRAWQGDVSELSLTESVSSAAPASQDQPLPLPASQDALDQPLPPPDISAEDMALGHDNSISSLTHTSLESPPLERRQAATPSSSSSQSSLPLQDSPLPDYPVSSAYHYLLKGAVGEDGADTPLSLSESSGELTDAKVERELLQVLEGGRVGVTKDERPTEVPSEGPQVDPEGSGTDEKEESSESTSLRYVPSSRSQSTARQSQGQAPPTMNASLKRRLGK